VKQDLRKISAVNRPSFLTHDSEKIGQEKIDFFIRSMDTTRPATLREVLQIETSYLRVIADY